MTSVGEVSRFDVVLEVKSPDDTLKHTFAAVRYKRMLTTSNDLSAQVGAIFILRLESVSRPERAGLSMVLANEDFRPPLVVGPVRRAFRGLNEYVVTTFQVPSQFEGKVGILTFRVGTFIRSGKKADSRYLCRSPSERRGGNRHNNTA